MNLGELCNRDVVVIEQHESITAAARLMRQYHVGTVVVVTRDQERTVPKGIVTDRDLVINLLAADVVPETVNVGDVMSFELLTADEHSEVWEGMQRMRKSGVRRLVVIDRAGSLVGIVTVDDLLEFFAEQLGTIVALIEREGDRELRTRSRP